jgi:hypothetical protein
MEYRLEHGWARLGESCIDHWQLARLEPPDLVHRAAERGVDEGCPPLSREMRRGGDSTRRSRRHRIAGAGGNDTQRTIEAAEPSIVSMAVDDLDA